MPRQSEKWQCCTVETITIAGGIWDIIDAVYWFFALIFSTVYVALFYELSPLLEKDIKYVAPIFFLSNLPRLIVFVVLLCKDMSREWRLFYFVVRIISCIVWLGCYIPMIIESADVMGLAGITGIAEQ
jgi:hypothetical protein